LEIINIFVLGIIGHGKSCFINTSLASLCGTYMNLAKSISGGKSFTRYLEGFNDNESRIRLIDSYGVQSNDNYKYLDLIINGNILEGYNDLDLLDYDEKSLKDHKIWKNNPTINDKIHGIIIVFDPEGLNVSDDTTALRALITKIKDCPFRLVVPKLDNHDPYLKEDPLFIGSSRIVNEIVEEIANNGISLKEQIYPIVSSVDTSRFNDGICNLFLNLFQTFLEVDIQGYFRRIFPNVINPNNEILFTRKSFSYKCTGCGEMITNPKWKSCPNCSTPITKQEPEFSPYKCTGCKEMITNPKWKSCPNCSTPISKQEPEFSPYECKNCGEMITNPKWKSCPNCETKLVPPKKEPEFSPYRCIICEEMITNPKWKACPNCETKLEQLKREPEFSPYKCTECEEMITNPKWKSCPNCETKLVPPKKEPEFSPYKCTECEEMITNPKWKACPNCETKLEQPKTLSSING